MSVQDWGNIS